MEIREVIRRLRAGESDRAIHRALKIHRKTIRKYREWAEEQGLLASDELPTLEALQQRLDDTLPESPPPQNCSSVAGYRELVVGWREQGVEIAAIHQRLQERGYIGSYSAVRRFVRQMEPRTPQATVRIERPPGEEAQVDFGYAGKLIDPQSGEARRAWAFVITLSWSRHQYVRFVFDQKVATWLDCHRRAFEFFGGVPRRLVIDNLKAAITRASGDDPQVQHAYRECAEHYGFLIAPCRVRTPEHKGKVEQGGVHYVKRNFLGGREISTLSQANREVHQWCLQTAGQRVHGTTRVRPIERFEQVEQASLLALPAQSYDLGVWKQLKLHRDGYVVFEKSYYSAPFTHIGQQLRVRGGINQVRIYTQDHQLIATHDRAQQPGTRRTHPDHLPPEKQHGWQLNRETAQAEAAQIGSATLKVAEALLGDRVIERLPMVGRLLRLRQRFGDRRLEAACQRALHFDDPAYKTVKRILEQSLDQQPLPPASPSPPPATRFVRQVSELVGQVLGGLAWN